jgi:outer membrane protein assembly factor BamB
MNDSASPTRATASPPRPLVPGWTVRGIVALALVLMVLSRALPRLAYPPFPFNDQAFANLLGLGAAVGAMATLWVWFCFFSGYSRLAQRVVFFGALLIAAGFFGFFRLKEFSGNMVARFEPRWNDLPDYRLPPIPVVPEAKKISLSSPDPRAFPQFLGPDQSAWVSDPGLATDWSAHPPKLLWRQPIGAGWSAFAASNGVAVTLEQRGDREWVSCYRIEDGHALWGQAHEARHENAMGGIGPRSTPTISGGQIFTVGATGLVQCLSPQGKVVWQVDLFERYEMSQTEAEVEVMWGRAGSPLVTDGLVIVPGGGRTGISNQPKSLIALDVESGDVVWEEGTDQISYASPIVATLAGVRQIVIVNEKTVAGHDPGSGRLLWQHPWPGDSSSSATSSQAVVVDSDKLLLTKGYGGGAELIRVSPVAGKKELTVEQVEKNPRVLQTKFTNVAVIDSYVYGLSDGILECVDLESLQRQWKQGRYGHGQLLGVGNLLLVISEDGQVVMIEADPDDLVELGSFQAIEGRTWNNLCLYGTRLLVRNSEEAACYELPSK